MKNLNVLFLLCLFNSILAQNKIPSIDNLTVDHLNSILTIQYAVSDTETDDLEVQCLIWSNDNTSRYTPVVPVSVSGDIGFPISPGNNKMITVQLDPQSPAQLVVQLRIGDRQTLNISELVDQVSKDSLYKHISTLQGRRNSGNPTFYAQSRSYIETIFNTYMPSISLQTLVNGMNNINYQAQKFGSSQPDEFYCFDAHYDSFGAAPGADDNASGVAGILEAVRILGPYSCQKSVRVLAFDLEEQGLVGSNLYVTALRNTRDKIKGVVNFEMIGYYSDQVNSQDFPNGFNLLFPDAYNEVIANMRKGDFIINTANTISNELKLSFSNAAKLYVPSLKVISIEVPGNGSIAPDLLRSDHASFWRENIPALMITDGANFRNKNYHTVKDSIQYLNFDFMSDVVKASIGTVAKACLCEHATSKDVYIDLRVSNDNLTTPTDKLRIYYSHGKLYFQSTDEWEKAILTIFSPNGSLVYSGRINIPIHELTQIKLPIFKEGIYVMNIKNNFYSRVVKFYVNE